MKRAESPRHPFRKFDAHNLAQQQSEVDIELTYRYARPEDAGMLAPLNRALIEDEGAENPMDLPQLTERMRGWLEGAYSAIQFEADGQFVAYLLYKSNEDGVYIRQFVVDGEHRRKGLGTRCLDVFWQEYCERGKRVYLDVLLDNTAGRQFWKAVGFSECSVRMERSVPAGPE